MHAFLTLALDGGEWLASRSGRFTPGAAVLYAQTILKTLMC